MENPVGEKLDILCELVRTWSSSLEELTKRVSILEAQFNIVGCVLEDKISELEDANESDCGCGG